LNPYIYAMAVDEATQTNGVPEPSAGKLQAKDAQKEQWTVESGMS
jgi:putative hydrolase of HD superfamily